MKDTLKTNAKIISNMPQVIKKQEKDSFDIHEQISRIKPVIARLRNPGQMFSCSSFGKMVQIAFVFGSTSMKS